MSTKRNVRPVCVGTVVLQGNRVLLVRQAKGHPLEGQWTIPWGIVDPNEAPEAAAARETLEESGVAVKVEGLLGLQNLPEPEWIGLLFLCRHVEGVPHSDGGAETDAAAWFSLDQLTRHPEPVEALSAWLIRRVLAGTHHLVPAQPHNPFQPHLAFF